MTPGSVDIGPVHHDDLGAGVLDELGDRRPHSGGATDDERTLPVVPVCIEQRHDADVEKAVALRRQLVSLCDDTKSWPDFGGM